MTQTILQNHSGEAADAVGLPLSEQAYRLIRKAILIGHIEAGARLKMDELQRAYDVSSSPLREALNRLSAEGLVDLDERRGFRAAAISAEDLRDITAFRLNIECAALAESIDRGDVDWEAEILAAFHRLTRYDSREVGQGELPSEEWTVRHKAFHMALIGCCSSGRQLAACSSLFDQAERYRRLSVAWRKTKRDSVGEHRRIMEAALDRDAGRASALLREHIEKTSDHVAEMLPFRLAGSEGTAGRRRRRAERQPTE